MKKYWLFCFLSSCLFAHAQRDYKNPSIDVQHYTFSLTLNDENNSIRGEATISILFLQAVTAFDLDLVKKNAAGKGMTVTNVQENNHPATFTQEDELIHISTTAKPGDTINYTVGYEGIPADGLIIDKNKYGHRSFFGDNWPNRAHNWLPCIDNPADKAPVDFIVTAPEHYQIIANGVQVEENNLPNQLKQTHWKETVSLPAKVMVIGAADFAVNYAGDVDCIPVYSWVYPEDKDKGFYDYALAKDILPFFIKNVGPYAYHKLANVQSKTRFGGMENASAIFYFENSVQGNRKIEALLTHEIAHQWFGNSATEKSWPHIWLSEGFATCMTNLYLENKYGPDTLQKRLLEDREAVIAFSKKRNTPVVDTSVTSNFFQLLNANSYQKGGWVLHMLRRKVGDTIFWNGIRNYYAAYAGKNASTDDFRKVMEITSGQDLQTFFQQWLFTPGQPVLNTNWTYDAEKKTLVIVVTQKQAKLFSFPLQILIQSENGKEIKTFDIKEKSTTLRFLSKTKPLSITADPNTNLLFEEVLNKDQ
jgi:aminopeptidase N